MLRTSQRLVRRCAAAPSRRGFSSGSGNWLGIGSEYLSPRGLAIAGRVLSGMSDFVRYSRSKPRVFVSGASDEVRSSMYVLSQFPMATQVALPEFVRGAERAANIVLEKLYAQERTEIKELLEQMATPESLKTLLNKPSAPVESKTVLEQLNFNSAALEAVEYTREREEGDVKREWLTLRVRYDVTEHLLLCPNDGEGIEDQRAINTQFAWTFEAEVTADEGLEWGIVAATPFDEKPAVLTVKEAQTQEEGE